MSRKASPNAILMIRPASFGFNIETASSNAFQQRSSEDQTGIQKMALEEFDAVVTLFKQHSIDVQVVEDTEDPKKPDAIFPNNWFSTHQEGLIIRYPMLAPNRRIERRDEVINIIKAKSGITKEIDFSPEENEGRFLEGTGSIVFDHANRIAYACRSSRTDERLVKKLCQQLNYEPIVFDAIDESGKSIYHTNVMMWVGEKVAGLCLDSIKDDTQQEVVLTKLADPGHKVVAISYQQMNSFAGNMFEVKNKSNEPFVLMSQSAFDSLLPGQLNEISKYAEPLVVKIDTIERYGGGSIRCMVAGIYL